MEIGAAVFIVAVLIIAIWVIIEVKRMRHKVFAIFLIALILFLYLSASFVFKGQDVDLKTFNGITNGAKLYFSWLGSAFNNFKTITSNAVQMDWQNSTAG